MILNDLNNINDNFFSVIIIGSGPAGISTALKLEELNVRTLLIEAGGLELDSESEDFLKGNVYAEDYYDISTRRARMFGGTSNLWGGHCNKFEKEQFSNWPIDYDDLHSYEDEAKKVLGLKFYYTDFYIKKFNEDFNQYNTRFSDKSRNFKDVYYDRIKNSNYIYLSLNTSFLHFEGEKDNISSVYCRKKSNFYSLKAKYFVLAAGGIENSRLLLWSKEKNKRLFDDNLPIGKYYMDHPYYDPAEGFIKYDKVSKYLDKTKGRSREFYVDCYNRVNLSPNLKFRSERDIDGLTFFWNFNHKSASNSSYIKKITCMTPNIIKNFLLRENTEDLINFKISINQEQEPEANNRITLSNDLDPYGTPLIDLTWKMSNKMKRCAKENLLRLGKFLVEKDMGRIAINEDIFSYDNFKTKLNAGHQMGGTCAGKNKLNSVVDKNLKVHSIDNLFVTGSSVFTTSGHGNPTYTIVLLSLKLADHLKKII